MSASHKNIGVSAVSAALEKARKKSGTASVVAALVPLATLVAPNAGLALPTGVDIATSPITQSGSHYYETFTFTYDNGPASENIYSVDIPELNAGDINFNYLGNSNGIGSAVTTIAEVTDPNYAGTPTENHYIEFIWSGTTFGSGYKPLTFTALVSSNQTTPVSAGVEDYSGTNFTTAPFSVPNPATVPEPGSLAILATAAVGLIRARRRG